MSEDGPSFYPDLSVFCGKIQYLDASLDCALNPVVLLEVTSKSTRQFDRDTSLIVHYRQMASVRHIALIWQFSVSVEHHVREGDVRWKVQTLEDQRSTLELSAGGVTLPLAKIYEVVSLRAQS